ncbi:hypothetical protein MNBD_GAMMA23-1283 [hydrothermal vent metagenome]|uniref:Uncharacterized protein n=1 Tax=hydrothermal vent metagenome TaxID=652676 RepID=A0A3B1AWE7_9ZZZZ
MPNAKTHDYVEQICQQGCDIVRQHIEALEQATPSPSLELLQGLNKAQQQEILKELKAIMAVYDNKDCSED